MEKKWNYNRHNKMAKPSLAASFFIVFYSVVFFKVAEIQAESTSGKFSLKPSWNFNPFSMNSWYRLPSQIMQYWFPLFQSAYYPVYLKKPTTTTTTPVTVTKNDTEKATQTSKPKTDNIFGVSGPPDDDVEYLPAQHEIEW